MSIKSKVYICIMAFSLAVIVAVLSARRIQKVWFPEHTDTQQETLSAEDTFYPFALQDDAATAENPEQVQNRIAIAVKEEEAYVPQKEMPKPYFGGQIDLPALAQEQKAYIIEQNKQGALPEAQDYVKGQGNEIVFSVLGTDPRLDKFVEEMKNALGTDKLNANLSPEEMTKEILNNPQIQKILLEYSKDPKIMEMIGVVMQEQQSLQQNKNSTR